MWSFPIGISTLNLKELNLLERYNVPDSCIWKSKSKQIKPKFFMNKCTNNAVPDTLDYAIKYSHRFFQINSINAIYLLT